MKTKIKSSRHPDNNVKPVPTSPHDIELPEGLYIRVKAHCRVCGTSYNYIGDIEDFDQDMSYCGRSYRCCP